MANYEGHSIKFENAEYQLSIGSQSELKQMTALMPTRLEPLDHQRKAILKNRLTCMKMPDSAYKAVNPALIFNVSLEPAYSFNLCTFADKGSDRTSFKLEEHVLYIESDACRFEICKEQSDEASTRYRFSQVMDPFLKDNDYMI